MDNHQTPKKIQLETSTSENASVAVVPSPSPIHRPFSRRYSSHISTYDLPLEKNARGLTTPTGIFFFTVKLTVPLAYIYIVLIILRELCVAFPMAIHNRLVYYIPILSVVVDSMHKSSKFIEIWVVLEALFYIYLKIVILSLQCKDPLEACLSSAPFMELAERQDCWRKMMGCIMDDPVGFITGWFFDCKLQDISRQDVMDFISWSMFEGRNQEHLTDSEIEQLGKFVSELEWRISFFLYGSSVCNDSQLSENGCFDYPNLFKNCPTFTISKAEDEYSSLAPSNVEKSILMQTSHPTCQSTQHNVCKCPASAWHDDPQRRVDLQKHFSFQRSSDDESLPSFFTNLFLSYKKTYEQYKGGVSNIYENAYFTFVEKGSNVDKRLTAISSATQHQCTEAWNSLCNMKERLEIANRLAHRRKTIHKQLKRYYVMLDKMRQRSAVIPSRQMADLLRNITKCNESLISVENAAINAFARATGFAKKKILHITSIREPKRYAKYSYDPLLGLATYPLAFHCLILLFTDVGLRLIMRKKGFSRLQIGSIIYYFHPGNHGTDADDCHDDEIDEVPIIFCHGIGIGLIFYLPLIDELLKLGHPILLPEIPYVCGFRPWQNPLSILTPSEVCHTLTAILTMHGYSKGTFVGHSYGSSWTSYMCKYASSVVAAVVFLDPICFCLHHPCLTKSFVYHRPDPGSASYMIKTDVIVNWTIQRAFPWKNILLFTEDIPKIPCAIFLSDKDVLIPVNYVESYLRSKGAFFCDFNDVTRNHFEKGPINVTVFRDMAHGDWTERPSTAKTIATAIDISTLRYTNSKKK